MTLTREEVKKLHDLFSQPAPVSNWRLYEGGIDNIHELEEAGIIMKQTCYIQGPRFPELEPHD